LLILEIVFVLVILKLPIAYVCWVIWWAVKAEPEVGEIGGTDSFSWRPWRNQGPGPRKPRNGPHGSPTRSPERTPPPARRTTA
jgi:hypothetical protein